MPLLGDENELNFEERSTNEGKSNHVTFLFGGRPRSNCVRRTFIGVLHTVIYKLYTYDTQREPEKLSTPQRAIETKSLSPTTVGYITEQPSIRPRMS